MILIFSYYKYLTVVNMFSVRLFVSISIINELNNNIK